jgi:hypothetical protein
MKRGYLPSDGEKARALIGAWLHDDRTLEQQAIASLDGDTIDDLVWLAASLADYAARLVRLLAEQMDTDAASVLQSFHSGDEEP